MTTPLNSLPEKWRAPDPYDSNHYWEARGDQCADELEAALTAHNQRWLDLADKWEHEVAGTIPYEMYYQCPVAAVKAHARLRASELRTLAQRTPEAGGFDAGGKLSESDARSLGLIEDVPDDEIDRRKDALEKRFRQLGAAQTELVERLRGLQRYVADAGGVWPDDDGKLILKADLDALIKEVCGG